MFKIGEFSRLSRVSVRMLRHYDQMGLLQPSRTDTFTNYRYYTADQLPRLNRIIALRDLGFSLEKIARMLDDDLPNDQLLGMLKLRRSEIKLQLKDELARLSKLEARIAQLHDATGQGDYDVILRNVEPELIATLREVAADDDRIEEMFDALEIYVDQFNDARADRPPFTIYYDDEYRDTDIDAEVAVPLKYPVSENGTICVRSMPQLSNLACVVHVGGYSGIDRAYNALMQWIESNGYRMAGPIREVYLRYGADGLDFDLPHSYVTDESEQYVTELQIMVEKGQE